MRKFLILTILILLIAHPVSAMEYTAPLPPEDVLDLMPDTAQSFGEGLWNIILKVLPTVQPSLAEAMKTCFGVISAAFCVSLLGAIRYQNIRTVSLTASVSIGALMLRASDSLIRLGTETIVQISEYAKLLLPVMTAAMAAHGGQAESAALYTATAALDVVLSALISKVIVPMLYVFLCLAISSAALGEEMMKKLKSMIKNSMIWCMKTLLYVFTGYLSITGVIAGSADAAALKAAKLTISGCVPVVGNILSDASEAVILGAGIMKNAAGIYGLLAFAAIALEPFLRIGVQYLLLKITAGVCGIFADKTCTELIGDFSSAMGLVLALTGTVCLLFAISTICFMKGVN